MRPTVERPEAGLGGRRRRAKQAELVSIPKEANRIGHGGPSASLSKLLQLTYRVARAASGELYRQANRHRPVVLRSQLYKGRVETHLDNAPHSYRLAVH